MKKLIAAYTHIRLQDTPGGSGGSGTINEDACGVSEQTITVADGMGGGGKTISRDRLEDLLTTAMTEDARYLARTMCGHGDKVSVSNMVAWGLVDYITEFKPSTSEETRQYVDRVRSAINHLVPSKMDTTNVGSTLTYINDEKDIIIGAGDSLALTVYEGKMQFHNLDGFDSHSLMVLKEFDGGFDPYDRRDWDKLREHPHSNIVTNVVLLNDQLQDGNQHEYKLHQEPLNIDRSVPSVTFVMSDGVAPDFVNPIDIYHMAQKLFKGRIDRNDLDKLLRDIVKHAHDNTRDMWVSDPSQKTDDATIAAMYRDTLFDDSEIDLGGGQTEGSTDGKNWSADILDDSYEEVTDPKVSSKPVSNAWLSPDSQHDFSHDELEAQFYDADLPDEHIEEKIRADDRSFNSDPFYYVVGDHLTSMFDSFGKKYESVCISLRDSYASFEAGVREKLGSARVKVEGARENYSAWKETRAVEKEARESDRLAVQRDRLQQERRAADEKFRETVKSREQLSLRRKETESARKDLREARKVLWGERKDYVKDVVTSPMAKRVAVTSLGLAALIGAGTIVYQNKDALTQMYHDATHEETVFDRAEQAILTKDCDNLNLVYQDLKDRSTNGENGIFSTQYDVRRTMAEIDCELELKEIKNE